MCGIFAYIGKQNAYPVLIEGLRKLEYRGYDSAGISLFSSETNDISTFKKKGKVQDLVNFVGENTPSGKLGIGHTRWATHGKPNDVNSHPHQSNNGRLSLIHNGIIENYAVLKKALIQLGYSFSSDTDTEVLVNLISEVQEKNNLDLTQAVRLALTKVVGAYAIVIMDQNEPDMIVGARQSSPLVLGIGEHELLLGSDATPILPHTKEVVYLDDGEIVSLSSDLSYEIINHDNDIVTPIIKELDYTIEQLEKGGYEHFMLKEIFEQDKTVLESMRGRVMPDSPIVRLSGMDKAEFELKSIQRIVFIACGTSWHSGLIAEYLIEDLARIPVEVEYASEFRYRNPIIRETDLFIAISQSGETADTLAALELAKLKGAKTYGIVNVVGSSIARMADQGSYIHAGPEIGVASTKAFTSQVTVLAILAIYLGQLHGKLDQDRAKKLTTALLSIPEKIRTILSQDEEIKVIAQELKSASNALYLGRAYNFPVALEGALKLKEIFVTKDQEEFKKIADFCIEIPDIEDELSPLLSVIPLQLLSYYIAIYRGCNVDQPRNLAKSVTVE